MPKEDKEPSIGSNTHKLRFGDDRSYFAHLLERIRQIQRSTAAIAERKLGNGWDPSSIVETIYKIQPLPLWKIKEKVGVRPKGQKWFKDFRLTAENDSREILTATLVFIPLWVLHGYHECSYLRHASYRVDLRRDVVAVEFEGKSRKVRSERKIRRFVPSLIARHVPKIKPILSTESKYFVLDDVVELAWKRSEGRLCVSGDGRELRSIREIMRGELKIRRIFEVEQLKERDAVTQVALSPETKERVVERFRERFVRPPTDFKEIVSNTFEIDELNLYYAPFYVMKLRRIPNEDIVLDATSGESADEQTSSFIKATKRFEPTSNIKNSLKIDWRQSCA
jgi:hypothetical protein